MNKSLPQKRKDAEKLKWFVLAAFVSFTFFGGHRSLTAQSVDKVKLAEGVKSEFLHDSGFLERGDSVHSGRHNQHIQRS